MALDFVIYLIVILIVLILLYKLVKFAFKVAIIFLLILIVLSIFSGYQAVRDFNKIKENPNKVLLFSIDKEIVCGVESFGENIKLVGEEKLNEIKQNISEGKEVKPYYFAFIYDLTKIAKDNIVVENRNVSKEKIFEIIKAQNTKELMERELGGIALVGSDQEVRNNLCLAIYTSANTGKEFYIDALRKGAIDIYPHKVYFKLLKIIPFNFVKSKVSS